MKITKAQKSLLDEINNKIIVRVHGGYKPALKLIELELVSHRAVDYGMIELRPKKWHTITTTRPRPLRSFAHGGVFFCVLYNDLTTGGQNA